MTSSASMGESALAAQLCCSDMLPCMVKQGHELNVRECKCGAVEADLGRHLAQALQQLCSSGLLQGKAP